MSVLGFFLRRKRQVYPRKGKSEPHVCIRGCLCYVWPVLECYCACRCVRVRQRAPLQVIAVRYAKHMRCITSRRPEWWNDHACNVEILGLFHSRLIGGMLEHPFIHFYNLTNVGGRVCLCLPFTNFYNYR